MAKPPGRRRNPRISSSGAAPARKVPNDIASTARKYRRRIVSRDADGYEWVDPSPTAWPFVKPDGMAGRPPGPRTQMVGYNRKDQRIRTVFRDGTPWHYDDVSPEEWEQLRREPSTGRYINRVLNYKPYGPGF